MTMSAFIPTFSSSSEATIRVPEGDLDIMNKTLAKGTEVNKKARLINFKN